MTEGTNYVLGSVSSFDMLGHSSQLETGECDSR